MSVEVVVPWRSGCPHRERALDWALDRYREKHPDWTVVVSEHNDGEWVKALAVMPAIEAAHSETVVVADADCWTEGLQAAVGAVEAGAPWVVPHGQVHRLTEHATTDFLAGAELPGLELTEHAYPGMEGGGFVVAPRATLLDVPLDPRFVGWGGEDQAWAMALLYLAGQAWRGSAPLIHLWHPPQPRISRNRGADASHRLYRRYGKARRSKADMRKLLNEIGRVDVARDAA